MAEERDEERREIRAPSLVDALIPLVALVVSIGGSLLSVLYGFAGFKLTRVDPSVEGFLAGEPESPSRASPSGDDR